MGRRNINTTKSGKFMNPTDRARKEARRRELKKNKKQRMAVRQAVLKSKDALMLLEEAELYDRQEFDPKFSTSLSDRVLQEKRKKLLETFDRMIVLYRKEEPDKAGDLQTMRNEYEKKRGEMIMFYEQVKLAERVNANEIPLPDQMAPEQSHLPQLVMPSYLGDIPLPPGVSIPPHPGLLAAAALASSIIPMPASTLMPAIVGPSKGILKIPGPPPGLPSLYKKPCAPPPGTPDELSEVDSDSNDSNDDGDEDGEELPEQVKPPIESARKIRFADDDQYSNMAVMAMAMLPPKVPTSLSSIPPPGFLPPPNRIPVPPGLPPPPSMIGVAPGYHPNTSSISVPAQMFSKPASRLPQTSTKKGADNSHHHHHQQQQQQQQQKKPLIGTTTIEAKPQLKNLIGDSTKLVPTALRIRKNASKVPPKAKAGLVESKDKYNMKEFAASKDDAYDVFMREMEGLL